MDDVSVTFTCDGRKFTLHRHDVEMVLRGVPPEPLRSHGVEVGGQWYPVKQALALATGVDRSDFISTAARRVFKKLRFPVRHD